MILNTENGCRMEKKKKIKKERKKKKRDWLDVP